MDPTSGKTASHFRTTSWTLIARARHSPGDLETLLARYWSPVYAYLRRHGQTPEDAADLTQAFLADVVLDRDLVSRADPDAGRFRSFLITSLKRFVIDQHRHARGRDASSPRRRATFVPDDPDLLNAAEPDHTDDPGRAFDRQWAATVLDTALQRVHADCQQNGMARQWSAFEARVMRPITHDCNPLPIDNLVDSLSAAGPQEIYSMLQTIKRKLQRELREVVAETVAEPEDVDRELADLRRFLAIGG